MGNIRYIAILIFALVGGVSCTIDDGYGVYDEHKTAAGKMVYDQTQRTLLSYKEILDFAMKVDSYLQATGAERDSIKYYDLAGWDILEDDDTLRMKAMYYSHLMIVRNSTNSLNTPSTQWKIKGSIESPFSGVIAIPQDGFVLTAGSVSDTWRVDVKDLYHDMPGTQSSTTLDVRRYYRSGYRRYDYEIVTVADAVSVISNVSEHDPNLFEVSYQVTEPLQTANHLFDDGKIDMSVVRASSSEVDDVTAEIQSEGMVTIIFRGITEHWNSDSIYY